MMRTLIHHKEKNFKWNFINIYGAVHEDRKVIFYVSYSLFVSTAKCICLLVVTLTF